MIDLSWEANSGSSAQLSTSAWTRSPSAIHTNPALRQSPKSLRLLPTSVPCHVFQPLKHGVFSRIHTQLHLNWMLRSRCNKTINLQCDTEKMQHTL
jgi:hypothetical protein